jgi:hypothetical protein
MVRRTTKTSVGKFSVPAKIITRKFLSNSQYSYCLNQFSRSVRHNVESFSTLSLILSSHLILDPSNGHIHATNFLQRRKRRGVKSDVIKTEMEVTLKEKIAVRKWKCKNKKSGCTNNTNCPSYFFFLNINSRSEAGCDDTNIH